MIIGNSIIFLFTWSGFIFGNILGILLSKVNFDKYKELKLVTTSCILGIISTLVFFFWTNFGVVVTTTSYTKDFAGLMQSYVNALAFLRPQLSSNLILVPLIFASILLFNKLLIQKDIKILS